MNLYLLHTNPETLYGFEEINAKYLDKLLAFVEKDELPFISDLLLEEENVEFYKFIFNTRKGNCPFDDGSGSHDYYEMFHEQHLKVYSEHWLEPDSEYLTLWIKMKPEFIKWLKSGYKKSE